MKIQEPSFEIWLQEPGLEGIYRQIERAGRVCYKSEALRTADSARPFVERMISNEHTAMLEHGTVYLVFSASGKHAHGHDTGTPCAEAEKYAHNRFSRVRVVDGQAYVTTNLRVLAENKWMGDLARLTEPTRQHERRITVHFTTQIGTTREFNRHRANSMAEQSTRYCNYAKSKFGNEITVNRPAWVVGVEPSGSLESLFEKVVAGTASDEENWLFANLAAEKAYMNLTASGRKPQEARAVLPLDTNTELVHTAFVSDWKHFFNLRAIGTTGAPHPDAKMLAEPLMAAFETLGLLSED